MRASARCSAEREKPASPKPDMCRKHLRLCDVARHAQRSDDLVPNGGILGVAEGLNFQCADVWSLGVK